MKINVLLTACHCQGLPHVRTTHLRTTHSLWSAQNHLRIENSSLTSQKALSHLDTGPAFLHPQQALTAAPQALSSAALQLGMARLKTKMLVSALCSTFWRMQREQGPGERLSMTGILSVEDQDSSDTDSISSTAHASFLVSPPLALLTSHNYGKLFIPDDPVATGTLQGICPSNPAVAS